MVVSEATDTGRSHENDNMVDVVCRNY